MKPKDCTMAAFISRHEITIRTIGLLLTVATAGLALPILFAPELFGEPEDRP